MYRNTDIKLLIKTNTRTQGASIASDRNGDTVQAWYGMRCCDHSVSRQIQVNVMSASPEMWDHTPSDCLLSHSAMFFQHPLPGVANGTYRQNPNTTDPARSLTAGDVVTACDDRGFFIGFVRRL